MIWIGTTFSMRPAAETLTQRRQEKGPLKESAYQGVFFGFEKIRNPAHHRGSVGEGQLFESRKGRRGQLDFGLDGLVRERFEGLDEFPGRGLLPR